MQYDFEALDSPERELELRMFTDHKPIPAQKMIGERAAIFGASGSGKSVTAATLAEEIALLSMNFRTALIDVENDYTTLAKWRPHLFTMYGDQIPITTTDIPNIVSDLIYGTKSIVMYVGNIINEADQHKVIALFLKTLWNYMNYIREHDSNSLAISVFIDEAHHLVPQKRIVNQEIYDAVSLIARQGRKRNYGLIVISQRPAEISKTVLGNCNYFFMHRVSWNTDIKLYGEILTLTDDSDNLKLVRLKNASMEQGDCWFFHPSYRKGVEGQDYVHVRMRHSQHTSDTANIEGLIL